MFDGCVSLVPLVGDGFVRADCVEVVLVAGLVGRAEGTSVEFFIVDS